MKSKNKCLLIGNVGNPPEYKEFSNGGGCLKFRLATSRRVKVGEQWEDRAVWHKVVLFNKFSERWADRIRVGDQLMIEGAVETRDYESEGQKKYITEIIVRDAWEGHGVDQVKSRQPAESRRTEAEPGQFGFGKADIPF